MAEKLTDAEKDQVATLVRGLVGYQMTFAKEEEITEIAGREIEDVALDYNVERCSECGVWTESCMLNEGLADRGEVICTSCVPNGREDEDDDD